MSVPPAIDETEAVDRPPPSEFARPKGRAARALAWLKERAPGFGWVLLVWVLSRLAFYLPAYLGIWLLPENTAEPARVDVHGRWLLALHWRWDAIYYYSIATEGYAWDSLSGFFPGLPLLIRGVATVLMGFHQPTGRAIQVADRWPLVAGVLVAHVVALLAFWVLFQLAREELGDEDGARRATLYAAIFPFAFVYSMPFTEGLFLATTVGMFLAARRGHWVRAGLLAGIASATRVVGILVVPALALEIFLAWRRGALLGRSRIRAILGLALAPMGLLLFMIYLWFHQGDPLAFAHVQETAWGHELIFPVATLIRGIDYALHPGMSDTPSNWINGLIHTVGVLFVLAVFLASLRRWRPSYVLYGALLLGFVLATPNPQQWTMDGMGRYVMVLFPIYLTLARWGRRAAVDRTLLVLFLPLFGLFSALTVRWFGIS